ncbi:hypothetical protein PPTG_17826 [Phytophthora nicotianae INRA-310]|uniref:Uncharacterized protein n=1 Tax=Phytophthora nicotianae (strain INRA-310) TaxID=761204 RepID=W2PHW3_PHYN3|nr:hypothetical protein PPTG_17826 [Phytophthora nicotianae INRA-310]ETN00613.1 hypothetical protein PPTG_17826 [Phytophthora nicotianae INRA-310]
MAHDRSTHDEIPVSPKKKLKITIEKHKRKVFDTVDDLREFIMHIDDNDKDVCALARIKARLLWIASDTVRGLHFLRLYFGEWQAPEPFKEQQQVITPFKHLAAVNQFLNGSSEYAEASAVQDFPPPSGPTIHKTAYVRLEHRRIWYQLFDAVTRGAFQNTAPTAILRTEDAEIIQEFCENVKAFCDDSSISERSVSKIIQCSSRKSYQTPPLSLTNKSMTTLTTGWAVMHT